MKNIYLGITMRMCRTGEHSESRDALSCDWIGYLKTVLPGAIVVPILNDPRNALKVLKEIGMGGVILSGGDDIAAYPQRDLTEIAVLKYCLSKRIPLLGVCRGMQMLHVMFGGRLCQDIKKESGEDHIRKIHRVTIGVTGPFRDYIDGDFITVNSYHRQGVIPGDVSGSLKVFGRTAGGVVEGVYHPSRPVVGIQWHPERKTPSESFDRKLIRGLFIS